MEQLQIGLLLPTSTILPLGKDFERGLKDGLKNNTDLRIEIVKEFIGPGGHKQAEEACNKLFSFYDVDVITGILSNRATDGLADKFRTKKTPFIISNTGEHLPSLPKLNDYTYINSMDLWAQAWAAGYWGVKTFGKKGMYVSAMYDGGYSFSHMFYEGMKAADPECDWSFSIAPMPPQGELSDIQTFFPYIEKYEPDFIFATFCGTETTLFLNEFIARGHHKKINIIGLPFLLAPFEPLNEDIEIYTTVPFVHTPDITADKSFYHLGYRAGSFIAKASVAENGIPFKDQLQKETALYAASAQGENASFNVPVQQTKFIKNNIKAGAKAFKYTLLTDTEKIMAPDEFLTSKNNEPAFGWINPYLCI